MIINLRIEATVEDTDQLPQLEEMVSHLVQDLRANAAVNATFTHWFRGPVQFDGQTVPPRTESVVFVEAIQTPPEAPV